MDRVLEKHEDHHDAEYLQAVAGHVHHDGVHGEGLGGCEGDFPGFFDFEGVGFFGGWGFALGGLFGGGALKWISIGPGGGGGVGGLALPPSAAEYPGGSGMFEDLGLGLEGFVRSVTHRGGGRDSGDVFEAILSYEWDGIEGLC